MAWLGSVTNVTVSPALGVDVAIAPRLLHFLLYCLALLLLSCLVLSVLVFARHDASCLVLCRLVLSCLVSSRLVSFRLVLSCLALSCLGSSRLSCLALVCLYNTDSSALPAFSAQTHRLCILVVGIVTRPISFLIQIHAACGYLPLSGVPRERPQKLSGACRRVPGEATK